MLRVRSFAAVTAMLALVACGKGGESGALAAKPAAKAASGAAAVLLLSPEDLRSVTLGGDALTRGGGARRSAIHLGLVDDLDLHRPQPREKRVHQIWGYKARWERVVDVIPGQMIMLTSGADEIAQTCLHVR